MIVENIIKQTTSTFPYLGIFIALFLESFPFLGALIPGGIIVIFFVGTLARRGYLNPWLTFLVCVLASFSVDLFGYFLGRKRGEALIHKYSKYLLIKKEFLHKLADILKRHPKRLLILGKFNPATRSIVPFMSGMKKIPSEQFILYSLVNTLLRAGIFFGLVFLFGKGVQTATWLGKMAVIGTIALFLIGYFIYLIRDIVRKKKNGANKQNKN